ncbi:MAG: glycosyltransferase family 2 protein [Brachymonas sp.]|nr:glycosyltransferase family 2 protein [Brachymonas sp.]
MSTPPSAFPEKPLLSCIVPAYNEAANLQVFIPALVAKLQQIGHSFEIIVVNDGSKDDSEPVLGRLAAHTPGLRARHLSRNFGKEAAITAGLDAARGAAMVIIDADLQHPLDLIPSMLSHWYEGAEVVYAVRENRADEGALKKMGVNLFYRIVNKGARFEMPPDAGDFRLLDRKVVNALRSLPERNRFMKGLYAWVGFRTVALPYTPLPRQMGASTFGAFKLLNFAIDGLTSFSTLPLRFISVAGVVSAVLAFLYSLWVVAQYLLWGNEVSGWSTIVVLLLLFFGMQMVFTGVLGEYIARIFEEVKRRPIYIVSHEEGLPPPGSPPAAHTDTPEQDNA